MKLLVQSDDYGITVAQACGAIYGIKNGIIRNAGLFVNMPWSEECVEMIYPYLDKIAFGIDLNASTGRALLNHEKIPSLTHADGSFLTSSENRALDTAENNFDHMNYDELYKEFEEQIKRFISLTGRLPDYIHPHAYMTETTKRVISDLAEKYDRPFSMEFMEKYFHEKYARMSWVQTGEPNIQIQSDLKNYILKDEVGFLNKQVGYLVTHCGFVDDLIMKMSSFNLVRMKDLEALTSKEVKEWVSENQIELVTFNDLLRQVREKEESELY